MKTRKAIPPAAVYGLIAAGALFVALVGYMLLVKPQSSRLSDLKRQLDDTNKTIQLYQTEAAASKPTAVPEIRVADVYRLARAMPSASDMPDVLIQLSSVASSAGVVLDGITPGATTPGNGFQTLPLQVSFHGDFYAVTDFLYRLRTLVNVRHGRLEAGGRLFAVQSVSFTPVGIGSSTVTAQMGLVTYVYAGGPAPTATVPALPTTTDSSASSGATASASASAQGAP